LAAEKAAPIVYRKVCIMFKGIITKVFGTRSEREIKAIEPYIKKIESLEDEYRNLTDEQLREKTTQFKQRLADGQTLDDILPEAFATVREAADRVLGMRPYRVQLIGGIVLHQGRCGRFAIVPKCPCGKGSAHRNG
jgi:preprotein translocase subunit SecA